MTSVKAQTILVVEDNEELVGVYVEVLECLGYRVLAARSGDDALALGEREASDIALVLTDLTIPGTTGTEIYRALRALGVRAPAIVFSGYPAPADASAQEGVVAWLEKPLEVEELLAAIERALRPN